MKLNTFFYSRTKYTIKKKIQLCISGSVAVESPDFFPFVFVSVTLLALETLLSANVDSLRDGKFRKAFLQLQVEVFAGRVLLDVERDELVLEVIRLNICKKMTTYRIPARSKIMSECVLRTFFGVRRCLKKTWIC